MAKIMISGNIGLGERVSNHSVSIGESLSEKTLSFYFKCTPDFLREIAESVGAVRTIKSINAEGKEIASYAIEDFPKLLQKRQDTIEGDDLNWLKDVDTTQGEFEIKFPSGTTMKYFSN